MILLSSYEFFCRLINEDQAFNRYDDYTFLYKFLQRFGASTLAVTLATAVCHPLDTMKRVYQLEDSLGHSGRNSRKIPMPRYMWLSGGKLKWFYRGFSAAMAKAIPLSFLQFICF